jgi:uncharacterized glyoxalase superfamily protein PhnB
MPRLDAIGIVAVDMRESIRFYRLLGVEVEDPPEDPAHHEATLPSGLRLMWDTEAVINSFAPEWRRTNGNQVALAFACESPADVDETYRRVLDAGFEGQRDPWDALWGYRYAQLTDPDGVTVDLFAPL